jgi:hypothetical protein
MIWIGRPAVGIDAQIEAASLDAALLAIVTRLAKRLQRTQSKLIPIPTMAREVIGDRCHASNSLA